MIYDKEENFKKRQFLIYFHGNAVDLGRVKYELTILRKKLKMNIVAMEYAGYGLYNETSSTID